MSRDSKQVQFQDLKINLNYNFIIIKNNKTLNLMNKLGAFLFLIYSIYCDIVISSSNYYHRKVNFLIFGGVTS